MSPLSGVTLLVNWREGHSACKKLGVGLLVVTVHDWSFAHCKAPVDTTTCSILSSDKIQNGDILVLANPGPLGKMAVKRRERRFFQRLLQIKPKKNVCGLLVSDFYPSCHRTVSVSTEWILYRYWQITQSKALKCNEYAMEFGTVVSLLRHRSFTVLCCVKNIVGLFVLFHCSIQLFGIYITYTCVRKKLNHGYYFCTTISHYLQWQFRQLGSLIFNGFSLFSCSVILVLSFHPSWVTP